MRITCGVDVGILNFVRRLCDSKKFEKKSANPREDKRGESDPLPSSTHYALLQYTFIERGTGSTWRTVMDTRVVEVWQFLFHSYVSDHNSFFTLRNENLSFFYSFITINLFCYYNRKSRKREMKISLSCPLMLPSLKIVLSR